MKFEELHEKIPYAIGKENYVVSYSPYPSVRVRLPGRHQGDTAPKGGDFLVVATCKSAGWSNHSFTHQDLFNDIQEKYNRNAVAADELVTNYARVVNGTDPTEIPIGFVSEWYGTLDSATMLTAGQCLAVAEHRRYHQHESRGGGRYLPVRFMTGIVEGLWTAEDAKSWVRKGRPGLDALIKMHGAPKPLESRY